MSYYDGDRKIIGCFFIITWILIIVAILTGCHTDNRIRTKPILDYKIAPAKQAECRLYVIRALWAEKQLRNYEDEKND